MWRVTNLDLIELGVPPEVLTQSLCYCEADAGSIGLSLSRCHRTTQGERYESQCTDAGVFGKLYGVPRHLHRNRAALPPTGWQTCRGGAHTAIVGLRRYLPDQYRFYAARISSACSHVWHMCRSMFGLRRELRADRTARQHDEEMRRRLPEMR
jgi:hypothetical protein